MLRLLRTCSFVAALGMTTSPSARAQDVAPLTPPADRALRFRSELQLDSAQVAKLKGLSQTQAVALGKATSAFLRAEADVVDAARSQDLAVRRLALERRSKAAIDGEMTRLRGEREIAALLTARQNDLLASLVATSVTDSNDRTHALWESQVAPLPLNASAYVVPDSGTMLLATEPLITEIYLADKRVGSGRLAIRLPVGQYTLKLRTPTCVDTITVTIEKGPPTTVPHKMSCGK